MREDADILIVGAGMTGISCARVLTAAGRQVRLVDKGRGIGGRMATRRVTLPEGEIRFDHGAQYLRPRAPDFAEALQEAGAQDWPDPAGAARLVGVPGMSALPRAMASALTVSQNVTVTALAREAAGWQVATTAGALVARIVVLTQPAPQVARVLGGTHPLVDALQGVEMAPCLTLMAAFPAASPRPFETLRDPDHPLAWIARDSSKPGRGAGPAAWVAQAGPAFSHTHLEATPDAITAQMLPLLCERIGADPASALHATAHRWRYSQTTRPLGKPFLRGDDAGLYLGGDWALGNRAEHAWTSGRAIAADILGTD